MTRFILRFDDICPTMNWENFHQFEDFLLEESRIKPLLGVVPENRDPKLKVQDEQKDFWSRVSHWRDLGWTIAQHGYTHTYALSDGGILKIGNKSEFSGLPYAVQLKKIQLGQKILQAKGVWQPYFMAPSHSFDQETLRALKKLNFVAITDGYGVYPYVMDGVIAVPQLFATPRNFGFGIYTLCIHVNRMKQSQIDKTLNFMRTNATSFISFPDALSLQRNDIPAKSMRLLSQGILRSIRLLRKLWGS